MARCYARTTKRRSLEFWPSGGVGLQLSANHSVINRWVAAARVTADRRGIGVAPIKSWGRGHLGNPCASGRRVAASTAAKLALLAVVALRSVRPVPGDGSLYCVAVWG